MTASVTPESKSPSRRALLAGALGGIGAWAASAIGRASPVRAEGETIHVGDEFSTASSVTKIANTANGATVLRGQSTGNGVNGSGSGIGVYGDSSSGIAVYGNSAASYGVAGDSGSSTGVHGTSYSGIGVNGTSSVNVGVAGDSGSFYGVYGTSSSNAGIVGQATSSSTGVLGYSGGGFAPPAKAKTAVYGYAAQDSTAKGLWGETTSGHAVHGTATSGFAGYFAGKVYTTKFVEMTEISAPAAPGANKARLFLKVSGTGKTQLCVRFQSGSVQVIKSEP